MNVFIYSDMEKRVRRIVEQYGVLGIDTCVEMIARLYDRKFCES